MSWNRIYRPKTAGSLHLANIKRTLRRFMKQGRIPQVLLFAGPKGTGKTSAARIIGAMLNDPLNEKIVDYQFFSGSKPQNQFYQEPDAERLFNQRIYRGHSFVVQEMDAASNRGIDDIRQLKERIALPPQDGKMTVYILDEAHMLTTPAFNALLKLLEEPPVHAVFILATTELHKIPETIKSRCSILNFRKATPDELKQALGEVLSAEKIKHDDEALDLIVNRADGSFRDAIKLLEMVATDGQVTVESVDTVLSSSVASDVTQLLVNTLDKDEVAVVELFQNLRSRNVDEQFFLKSLLSYLHTSLLQSLEVIPGKPFASRKVVQFLLTELSKVELMSSPISHLPLELKVLEIIGRANRQPSGGLESKKTSTATKQTGKLDQQTQKSTEINKKSQPKEGSEIELGDGSQLLKKWPQLLAAVKQRNVTVEALLHSAKPLDSDNGSARVQVYYQFHKEQLEHPKFRALINECAVPLAGGQIQINYELSQTPAEAELADSCESHDLAVLVEEVLI